MSDLGFPIKDLTRRKFQTILTIMGLTLSTAATIFLVTFGESLGFHVFLIMGEKLTIGLSYVFSLLIIIIGILTFLAGILVTSSLVSTNMYDRTQEIGIMKAIGCLTSSAISYFITELSIMVFTSCVAGTFLGISARYICINVLNALGFSIPQKPINLLVVLLVFFAFVISTHLLGARPILKANKVKPAKALSPLFSLEQTATLKGPVFSKRGFTFKVAFRSLMRKKFVTLQAIICLSAVLCLITVTVASGMIANQTTQNYVERAIGRDVILIAHTNLSRQYENLLSRFFEEKPIEQINYSDPEYFIDESLVTELNSIPKVIQVDPRIIFETTIVEVPSIVIDPEEEEPYRIIGDSRSRKTFVIGIDTEHVINKWLIEGSVLNSTDIYSALIGDSLAYQNFDDAQKQSVLIFNEKFKIAGVCLDPLNNGDVVYVPLKPLQDFTKSSGYNLLLLKIDPTNRSKIITEIENRISGKALDYLELNTILDKHLVFLNSIWSLIMALPLFSLVTASLSLLSFMMLSITGQQRELGIMRALGAKPRTILKIIFSQVLLIILTSGAIGISTGFILTWFFLILEAVISPFTIAVIIGWLLLSLTLICLTSLYPAVRITKKSIAQIIS